MKKALSSLMIAFFAVAMIAGGAFAAAGDLDHTVVNIAAEEAATYADGAAGTHYTNGTANAAALRYELGTSYVNNDIVTFTLSAGTFQDATYYLATQSDTTNFDDLTPTPNGKTPFAQISGGLGSSSLTFRVTDDTAEIDTDNDGAGDTSAVIAGTVYYVVTAADPDTGVGGTVDATAVPIVDVSSLVTPGTITCTIAAQTSTSLPLDTSGDKSEPLFRSYTQYAATVATQADETIDVGSGRLQFTGPATTDTIVLNITSDAGATIDDAEQITIAGADTITVTITGDMTGVSSVSDGTNAYTLDKVSSPNTASVTYTAAQITALNGAAAFGDGDETLAITLTLTVDGTTILNTRSFTADVSVNFETATEVDATLLSGAAAGAWDMNGWQGTVPYMWASSTASEDTFIKIFNDSTLDADVSVDVTNDAGTVTATVTLAQIPADTVGIYWAADIAAAAGVSVPGPFAATFTVNASADSVTAMANQKRPGAVDRVIPVYHDNDATYKAY